MDDTTATPTLPTREDRVPLRERLLAAIGGTLTALVGARRRTAAPAKKGRELGAQGIDQRRTVLVRKPAHEIYHLLHDLEVLPRFLEHLTRVEREDDHTWRFMIRDGERVLRWRVRLSEDLPGNCIAWESLPGGDIIAGGSISLRDGSRGGTVIDIELWYRPVEHRRGNEAATRLFERFSGRRLAANLLALRELLETDALRNELRAAAAAAAGAPLPAAHARTTPAPAPDLSWPRAQDLGPGPRG